MTDHGYLLQSPGGIGQARTFTRDLRCPLPAFALAAGWGMYYVAAPVFAALLERLPSSFFETSLEAQGQNRFFFESVIPSTLLALGAELSFSAGAELNPRLNAWCSYDRDRSHNSAVALREMTRWRADPQRYIQYPVPYIFGPLDVVDVAFNLYCPPHFAEALATER